MLMDWMSYGRGVQSWRKGRFCALGNTAEVLRSIQSSLQLVRFGYIARDYKAALLVLLTR